MKRVLSALLALALIFSMAACGAQEFRDPFGSRIRNERTIRDQIDKDERIRFDLVTGEAADEQDAPEAQEATEAPPQTEPASRPVAAEPTQPAPEATAPTAAEPTEPATEPTEPAAGPTEPEMEEPTGQPTEEAPTEPAAGETQAPTEPPAEETTPSFYSYTHKDEVALYIHTYGCLPENFITKSEARALGWRSGSLEPYAPGMCIGGDRFQNREGLLPEAPGRYYTECDIDTLGASSRGAKRIVFSNDGLIYYTSDHYASFTLLYGEP